MSSLAGKTLVMSGGSRGIGLAIALRAARDGANIAVLAKTISAHPTLPGTIYTAATEIELAGGHALPIACDIRDDDAVWSAVEQATVEFGGIDVCINNASAIDLSSTREISMKRHDLMFDINARGTFLLSKACIPHLERAGGGHILSLSPPLNLSPYWAAAHLSYTMSKYCMSLNTLGMAEELRASGIAVNSLWPKTTIATAAVQNIVGGDEMMGRSRTPAIMADAAYCILTTSPAEQTGQFLIDEDVLIAAGVTDLSVYRSIAGTDPLQQDLFLDDRVR